MGLLPPNDYGIQRCECVNISISLGGGYHNLISTCNGILTHHVRIVRGGYHNVIFTSKLYPTFVYLFIETSGNPCSADVWAPKELMNKVKMLQNFLVPPPPEWNCSWPRTTVAQSMECSSYSKNHRWPLRLLKLIRSDSN